METKEIAEVKAHVLTVQQNANALMITSNEEFVAAEAFSKQILDAEKKVTARKELITRPLMDSLASVRDLFKPLEAAIADAKKVVKAKRLAWSVAEEARIASEKAKVIARVEKGTMRPDTALRKIEGAGEAPKSGIRVLRKVRAVDEALTPREYLVPNVPAITDALLHKNTPVAGWEVYEEKTIV